jgi:hypothetical protein
MTLGSQCLDEQTGTQGRSHTCIKKMKLQILQTVTKEAVLPLICILHDSFNCTLNCSNYVTADDRNGK